MNLSINLLQSEIQRIKDILKDTKNPIKKRVLYTNIESFKKDITILQNYGLGKEYKDCPICRKKYGIFEANGYTRCVAGCGWKIEI